MRWSIIIFISLALACSKKESPAPAEAAKTPSEAESTEPAEAKGAEPSTAEPEGDPAAERRSLPPELEAAIPPLRAPPTIKVLDPGQEPHEALAWKLKPGLKQRLSLKLGSNTSALVTMLRFQSPLRTETYRIAIESKATDYTGALRMTFVIEQAKAKLDYPQPDLKDDHLKSAAASMRGIRGSYALAPNGGMEDFRIDLPPESSATAQEMADNLTWAFKRMYPVLPTDRVGEGAQWTAHRAVEQGGVLVNELATTRVTKRDGHRVELETRVQQAATKQDYTPPGKTDPVELSALWAEADGTVTLDLARLAPTSASLKADITKSTRSRATGSRKRVPAMLQTTRSLELPDI